MGGFECEQLPLSLSTSDPANDPAHHTEDKHVGLLHGELRIPVRKLTISNGARRRYAGRLGYLLVSWRCRRVCWQRWSKLGGVVLKWPSGVDWSKVSSTVFVTLTRFQFIRRTRMRYPALRRCTGVSRLRSKADSEKDSDSSLAPWRRTCIHGQQCQPSSRVVPPLLLSSLGRFTSPF